MARTKEEIDVDAAQILDEWFWNLNPKEQELLRSMFLLQGAKGYVIAARISPTFPLRDLSTLDKELKELEEQEKKANGTEHSPES